MVRGLVLGKFYPLHAGHVGLIEFALKKCDELIVLVCASDTEHIAGTIRLKWIQETFKNDACIQAVLINYSENELPNTSTSSKQVSKIWATKLNPSFRKLTSYLVPRNTVNTWRNF